jgi:hypothetical protein
MPAPPPGTTYKTSATHPLQSARPRVPISHLMLTRPTPQHLNARPTRTLCAHRRRLSVRAGRRRRRAHGLAGARRRAAHVLLVPMAEGPQAAGPARAAFRGAHGAARAHTAWLQRARAPPRRAPPRGRRRGCVAPRARAPRREERAARDGRPAPLTPRTKTPPLRFPAPDTPCTYSEDFAPGSLAHPQTTIHSSTRKDWSPLEASFADGVLTVCAVCTPRTCRTGSELRER